jgi:hypothetical protein
MFTRLLAPWRSTTKRLSCIPLRLERLETRATPSVSVVPQQFSTNEYTALSISQSQLLAGDSHSGTSGTLTVSNPTQPANATLVDNHNGTFTFTPNAAFSGTTTFQYTVGTGSSKLAAANATYHDAFGGAVAIDGDTAVVGAAFANGFSGAAYVFVRSGNNWVQQAELTGAGTGIGGFGSVVSISGDTAVIGAEQSTVEAAFVFVRSGSTWSQQAELTASAGTARNFFGLSVAISGDTAVIGAPGTTLNNKFSQGATYVFVRSGSTWSQQAELTAADGAAYQYFGTGVAIDGDTAVIESPNVGSIGGSGAAYVFNRSGSIWSQQAELTVAGAPDGITGGSVSISGDTVMAGAPNQGVLTQTVNGNLAQGAAYVYVRSGTSWTQQAELTVAAGQSFGSSVTLTGNTAVIAGTNDHGGTAYEFVRSGSTWSQQAEIAGGGYLAISGETVITAGQQGVVVQDLDAATATATVQVNPATAQLAVAPGSLPAVIEGQPYSSAVFTSTGGAGSDYTFQQSGILPPGLSFDAVHGQLVGAPTQVGIYPGIIIAASDGKGGSGSQTYTLTVNHYGENGFPVPYPLTIYTPPTSKSDPTANIDAFITGLYHSILDRNPESGSTGLPYWEGVFSAVQSGAGNVLNLTGVLPSINSPYAYVADAIWQSPEHRWDEIDTYYQDFLGRSIDPSSVTNNNERQYWANQFAFNGLTEEQVIRGFLISPEYLYDHRNDASLTQSLITSLLTTGASSSDVQAWSSALSALDAQRAAIQGQAIASPAAYQAALVSNLGALDNEAPNTGVLFDMLGSKEYRQAGLTAFYQAILRRTATAAELQTWLSAPSGTSQSLSLGTVAVSILGSQEYQTNAVNSEG